MDKFTSFLEEKLGPVALKVQGNKSMQAIMSGFMTILPITIMGAIFTLLGALNWAPYQSLITSTGLKTIFGFIPGITTNMLALYVSFGIGKALAENLGYKKEATPIGFITLFVFILMIPLGVSGTSASGEVVSIGNALTTSWLGSTGLFTAIVLGLIVPRVYLIAVKNNWTFKLPDGVPPMVSASFSSLVPAFIVAIVFAALRYGISLTSYGHMSAMIYALMQAPLQSMAASPFTFMLSLFLVSTFWFFGIHGGLVVMPFLSALYTPLSLENLAALEAGAALPNMIVQSDWFIFGMIGGGGATIGLALFYAFFAKSERYKTLGRISLPASLVGINEPITFGTPIVMNPIMMIPFFFTPLILWTISYILRLVGILPYLNGVNIPTGTPLIFSAFIAGGPITAVVQVGLIVLSFLIYFPFAKMLDNQALKDEEGTAE